MLTVQAGSGDQVSSLKGTSKARRKRKSSAYSAREPPLDKRERAPLAS